MKTIKREEAKADPKPTYATGQLVRNKRTKQEGRVYTLQHSGIWMVVVDVGTKGFPVWTATDVEAVEVKGESNDVVQS
jgi:hypothetical protein